MTAALSYNEPLVIAAPTIEFLPSPFVFWRAYAKAINLNALGDTEIALPPGITRYLVNSIRVVGATVTPTAAQVGVYTAASQGGTEISAPQTLTGATSPAQEISLTTVSGITTWAQTAANLFINVSVADGAALTADFYIIIMDLS